MIPFDIDQAGWESRKEYADGTLSPWVPDKWVVHYGGNANAAGEQRDNLAAQIGMEKSTLQGWQNYHIDARGWFDLAYCYAIGQSGLIYRVRGENRNGATAGDADYDDIPENHEARAVVFILGGEQIPTSAALASFQRMWQADQKPVIYHRYVHELGEGGTDTQCPGDFLVDWVRDEAYKESNMTVPDLTGPGEVFYASWQWAERHRIANEYTDPTDPVEKQEMIAFLKRYHDQVVIPAIAAITGGTAAHRRIAKLEKIIDDINTATER